VANKKSTYHNTDFAFVSIRDYWDGGEHNQVIPRGEDGAPSVGDEGGKFKIAWKASRDGVTVQEFDRYAAEVEFGRAFNFGPNEPGRVPD
jgi:hypothetical protein